VPGECNGNTGQVRHLACDRLDLADNSRGGNGNIGIGDDDAYQSFLLLLELRELLPPIVVEEIIDDLGIESLDNEGFIKRQIP